MKKIKQIMLILFIGSIVPNCGGGGGGGGGPGYDTSLGFDITSLTISGEAEDSLCNIVEVKIDGEEWHPDNQYFIFEDVTVFIEQKPNEIFSFDITAKDEVGNESKKVITVP